MHTIGFTWFLANLLIAGTIIRLVEITTANTRLAPLGAGLAIIY